MQAPPEADPGSGCPPGLEYLTQIDQLIVAQQMELLEGEPITRSCAYVLFVVLQQPINNAGCVAALFEACPHGVAAWVETDIVYLCVLVV